MPLLTATDYKPRLFFRQSHINTLYPYLFRNGANPDYQRSRFFTPDDDFVDLDWLRNDSGKLAILCHGLEGSSASQYIKNNAALLHQQGYEVCAMNYRSCSGEMNRTLNMYHSGFTHDLHALIQQQGHKYQSIVLVGFSLGGNMIMKYLGDGVYPVPTNVHKAVTMSVPCHLSTSSKKIGKWYNILYEKNFLGSLTVKMNAKHRQFPQQIKSDAIRKAKSLVAFDEYFTGPIHGFSGAEDYYAQCSSLQFLENIKVPTLLIQALDDPFLSPECFPYEIAKTSEYLYLKTPKYGGHVGFTTYGSNHYWNEIEVLNFIS